MTLDWANAVEISVQGNILVDFFLAFFRYLDNLTMYLTIRSLVDARPLIDVKYVTIEARYQFLPL